MAKRRVNIDTIKPDKLKGLVRRSGTNIVIEFDKFYSVNYDNLNLFRLPKRAFAKNLDDICKYINVFIEYYDQDSEYITSILQMKFLVDKENMVFGLDDFIARLNSHVLTETMIQKIWDCVNEQYSMNLTTNDAIAEANAHAMQFDNQHAKSLLAISMACKLTIPLICHYYYKRGLEAINAARRLSEKEMSFKDFLCSIFVSYFKLFQHDSNLYNKLYATVKNHIQRTIRPDAQMWHRAQNKFITPTVQACKVMEMVLTDLVPKYVFNKNCITLNHTSIPDNIKHVLIGKDKYDYFEMSTMPGDEELSGLEKLETNSAKMSDFDITISKVNIDQTIKRLKKQYEIKTPKEEIKFYKDNIKTFHFSNLISQFFANDFGGYYDLENIEKKDYFKLVIIFKTILGASGFTYLQHLVTGNISSKIKRRRINNKQMEKIKNSSRYQRVISQYSMFVDDSDDNPILATISTLINTPIEFIDYERKNDLGREIIIDADIVADEYLRLVESM